jgi:hypothetical protein
VLFWGLAGFMAVAYGLAIFAPSGPSEPPKQAEKSAADRLFDECKDLTANKTFTPAC